MSFPQIKFQQIRLQLWTLAEYTSDLHLRNRSAVYGWHFTCSRLTRLSGSSPTFVETCALTWLFCCVKSAGVSWLKWRRLNEWKNAIWFHRKFHCVCGCTVSVSLDSCAFGWELPRFETYKSASVLFFFQNCFATSETSSFLPRSKLAFQTLFAGKIRVPFLQDHRFVTSFIHNIWRCGFDQRWYFYGLHFPSPLFATRHVEPFPWHIDSASIRQPCTNWDEWNVTCSVACIVQLETDAAQLFGDSGFPTLGSAVKTYLLNVCFRKGIICWELAEMLTHVSTALYWRHYRHGYFTLHFSFIIRCRSKAQTTFGDFGDWMEEN